MIGNLTPPWTPSDDQMTQGLIVLNIMLKGWQADGLNLFRQEQVTLTVTANQGQPSNPYSITPLILDLTEARLVIQPSPNLYERPLGIYSYIDYMNLPNKQAANTAGPSIIMFDRQTNASNVYIWPLATNGCTINATVARTISDVNAPEDALDLPAEWTECVVYNLADRLMEDGGVRAADPATAQSITQHAIAFYTKLLNFDRPDSVFMRPWGRKGSGRFWS